MTYGIFLVVFLGAPLVVIAITGRRLLTRPLFLTLLVIALVAVIYTAPWDNLIIVNGVWSYGPHKVLGTVIGHVPLEEYVFYVLQVCLTGLVTAVLLARSRA